MQIDKAANMGTTPSMLVEQNINYFLRQSTSKNIAGKDNEQEIKAFYEITFYNHLDHSLICTMLKAKP